MKPIDKDFWLIDTTINRVVLAKDDVRYAALSYVWGPTRAKFTHFEALKNQSDSSCKYMNKAFAGNATAGLALPRDLPATIRDALTFCMAMGIRYLWVDSICIDQNSSEMKAHLVSKMHSIYMRAIFTIIAASGDNANAGLPGVRAGTRVDNRSRTNIKGKKFIVSYPTAKELITGSSWWKRAWTFQEGWLSPRCFIFTPNESIFACTQST